jgi:Rrf2 family protein
MDTILNISDAATLALHSMAFIARFSAGDNCSVATMAGEQGVSEAYLSKIMQRLVKVGLVTSQRGPGGGFLLTREASKISLLEILEAVDGPMFKHKCSLGRQRCLHGGCALGTLFTHVNYQVEAFMASRNLSDMLGSGRKHSDFLAGLGSASRKAKPRRRKASRKRKS